MNKFSIKLYKLQRIKKINQFNLIKSLIKDSMQVKIIKKKNATNIKIGNFNNY